MVALVEFPGQGMFPAPGTNNENVHEKKDCNWVNELLAKLNTQTIGTLFIYKITCRSYIIL